MWEPGTKLYPGPCQGCSGSTGFADAADNDLSPYIYYRNEHGSWHNPCIIFWLVPKSVSIVKNIEWRLLRLTSPPLLCSLQECVRPVFAPPFSMNLKNHHSLRAPRGFGWILCYNSFDIRFLLLPILFPSLTYMDCSEGHFPIAFPSVFFILKSVLRELNLKQLSFQLGLPWTCYINFQSHPHHHHHHHTYVHSVVAVVCLNICHHLWLYILKIFIMFIVWVNPSTHSHTKI